MFAGMAISMNSYLNAHTDEDFGMSAMRVLANDPSDLKIDSEVLAYMCLPGVEVSVALMHGDI